MRIIYFTRRALICVAFLASQAFAAGLPAEDAAALIDAYPMAGKPTADSIERVMLLGEKERQLGTLTLRINGTTQLILGELTQDASRKGWAMVSMARRGLDFSLTFSKQDRTLLLRAQQGENSLVVLSYTVIPSQRASNDSQATLSERRK